MCKTKNCKLTIELVPNTCWYTNVRSQVSRAEWDRLRKACYKKANYRCEICGGKGTSHPVECHEIWEYVEGKKKKPNKQILKGLIALCPKCHKVKHAGLAHIRGELNLVLNQLMVVNKWSHEDAFEYLRDAFDLYRERSNHQWELDISILNKL